MYCYECCTDIHGSLWSGDLMTFPRAPPAVDFSGMFQQFSTGCVTMKFCADIHELELV